MTLAELLPKMRNGGARPRARHEVRRIALYSHDAQGLGHMRRNIAIAGVLSDAEPSSILLIAGAREAALFALPAGTDTLALPALSKDLSGHYHSRSLSVDLDCMLRVRSYALRAALAGFEPDVLIVDKLPVGVGGELTGCLGLLEAMGTRLVLGLREVLDEPERVHAEWESQDALAVLRRHYAAIWVYGDSHVFDPVAEYGLPDDIAAMVRHSGYIDRLAGSRPTPMQAAARRHELELPDGPLALCLLGGGEDGYRLADAFARSALPAGTTGLIVTGPFMPERQQAALAGVAAARPDLRLLEFAPDADTLIALADQVVAMGGYNTSCEILASGRRALIVPRVEPRREQLIRAQRLSALGAVDLLDPADLTPGALSDWLAAGPRPPEKLARPIDMNGLRRLPGLLDEVLDDPAPAAPLAPRRPRHARPPRSRVALVTSGFPRLSETFALNELRALEAQGSLAALFATKPGERGGAQPGAESLVARVDVLPRSSPEDQAQALVDRLRGTAVTGVHGYFAHTPAQVARLAAGALDVPFGFSVHAKDARKVESAVLAQRVEAAACVVACNADVAADLPRRDGNVHLIPHGVDLLRFDGAPPAPAGVLRLLAVGRLVEKKGFDVLVDAVARLTVPFRLRIIGDGPQRERLAAAIAAAGLDGRVDLCGPRTHDQLPGEYAAADLVVVPSVVDGEGDRDGLPNVVLEAMASMRPVVASDVAALGSAVVDGETGLLVPPGDAGALASALDALGHRSAVRRRLGDNARARAEREFELGRCTDRFLGVMEAAYA
jgi:predicted glycosyltransferase